MGNVWFYVEYSDRLGLLAVSDRLNLISFLERVFRQGYPRQGAVEEGLSPLRQARQSLGGECGGRSRGCHCRDAGT